MSIAVIDSRTISDEARIASLIRRAVAPNLTPNTTATARGELHVLLKSTGVYDEWAARYRSAYDVRGAANRELTPRTMQVLVENTLKAMHSAAGRPLQLGALPFGLELQNDELCLPLLEGHVFKHLEKKPKPKPEYDLSY